jgi:hypothetical protein
VGIFIIILFVLVVVLGPLVLIWALNTLFALGIAYTFWTWLAALVLGWTVSGASARSSSD